jgi:hypothetical protein
VARRKRRRKRRGRRGGPELRNRRFERDALRVNRGECCLRCTKLGMYRTVMFASVYCQIMDLVHYPYLHTLSRYIRIVTISHHPHCHFLPSKIPHAAEQCTQTSLNQCRKMRMRSKAVPKAFLATTFPEVLDRSLAG